MPLPASPDELFNKRVPEVLAAKKPRVGMVYLFKITGPGGGEWTVDLFSPEPSCKPGNTGDARCTIEMTFEDFKKVMTQPSAAMQLYFTGKIKVVGDIQAVMKLQPVLAAFA